MVFPDYNLMTVVREKLGKPEGLLTRTDLSKLERLDVRDQARSPEVSKIKNLTGLEHAANLT